MAHDIHITVKLSLWRFWPCYYLALVASELGLYDIASTLIDIGIAGICVEVK